MANKPLKTRVLLLFAALFSAILFIGACSSGSDRSDVDPAARTAAVEKAKAGAAELLKAGVQDNEWTGPESSPAPKAGVRLTIIPEQMASTGSSRAANAIEDEAVKLGWVPKISDGQGKPDVQLNALNTAVDENADAVILVFVDTTRVQSALQRALDAGVKVVTLGSLKNTPETVPDVSFDWLRSGEAIAQYSVWKSGGDLGMLQMRNTDLYITVNGQYKGSQDYLEQEENCPGCNIETKDWSLASFEDPTTGPAAQAVATLQANSSLNWVSCFDSCLFRVANGLDRAGLSDRVSGAGYDCNPENLDIIRAGGSQKVCFADPREWLAFAAMDNINRMTNDQPAVDYTDALPVALFDKDSLDALPADQSEELEISGWQGNYDFRAKFEQLWGIA
ncbi:substrate-binding domain-containing protein [Rhodococcus sp. BP-349]|uniref:sugar ABC transporter substrate-binding protein n=1 Tax=unclassified Rhodococcus (in: high G+C Gram-positive bacteria) TaxID=192944 RepID=UPI001C9A9102|nr:MULTISPECIES: substrate-binding domain-containing protein [unclassified Rhodococcus (in: high G+C Gram-positive bacteria)]MBY6537288.1 substrate-binding domain-containing protein [Rhodococcus sp. BP-363]MBY6541625.1 substrate-binding domain-containing protein [Rhodococcus sp. BP-369]MBY6560855.1 substrate-binding domain-containing protein [Rhodococcus sp. BP-370]MBY6575147.1 substrate-binding domain-containing protein [Rhodococcus sp. BP-364]MBY6584448.1 substrate-binding domain-containing 